jgi:hypothetical protein
MQTPGCVINGGQHTHVYSNFTDQQVKIDLLTAKVEDLTLLVQQLTQLLKTQTEPKPEEEPKPVWRSVYDIDWECESVSDVPSLMSLDKEWEETDELNPDQPLTEEQEQLLSELQEISNTRSQLKHSGAPKKAFLKLNKRKSQIHSDLYGHMSRPTSADILNELITPPQNP